MKSPLLLAAFLLVFGCAAQQLPPDMAGAMNACLSECQKQMLSGANLSSGPCLLNSIPNYPGWVCDVAHSPREWQDNLAQNQCISFLNGTSRHFVEASPDCALIREQ